MCEEDKNLEYYKVNAEEDYINVPISVLRYITELEVEFNKKQNNYFKSSEKMAEWMHNNYEEIALNNGLKSQEDCTTFSELPEKNKQAIIELFDRFTATPKNKIY